MSNQKRIPYIKTITDSFLLSDHWGFSLARDLSGVIATAGNIAPVIIYPVCARTILRVRGDIS